MSYDPIADFLSGLDTQASGSSDRDRPDEGRGTYALDDYGPKKTEKGFIMVASLRVVKPAPGSTKKPGESCEIAWFIYKGAKEGGENEKARARDFVNALLCRPEKTPAGQASAKLVQPTQPGHGILIEIEGKHRTYTRKDGTRGENVNYTYHSVTGQTPQSIQAMRSQIELLKGNNAPATPPPAAAPVPPPAQHPGMMNNPFGGMMSPNPAPAAQPAAPSPFAGFPGFGTGGTGNDDIPF